MTRNFLFSLFATAACAVISTHSLVAQEGGIAELKEREKKVKAVVRDTMAATVAINGVSRPASGSGVIVNKEGLILTAAHVTAAAGEELLVIFPDGRTVKAKTLGANKSRDAGMAKITEEGDWPFIEIGDPEKLELGDWCVALGHPGGYDPNRTPPVRIGRVWTKGFLGMIGSDCTLVGGDSGGPLFNLDGELIGIHSSIGGQLSENRHVPMEAFQEDWDDMVAGQTWGRESTMMGRNAPADPERPALGVQLNTQSDKGLEVMGVSDGSPADKAGIQEGDLIRKIGKKEVESMNELVDALERYKIGDKVDVGLEREGEDLTLEVNLDRHGDLWPGGEPPRGRPDLEEEPEDSVDRPMLGAMLNGEVEDRAEIYEVVPDSPAAKAGLEGGDIVLEIDGDKIETALQMQENLGARKPGDEVTLLIQRGDDKKEIKAKLGKAE